MVTKEFTFNDLPAIVGELCERIASLESMLKESISNKNEVKENTHVLMNVQEACEYLKMPLSTFYFKVKNDGLPAIKQGKHLLVFRDELDKWLELSRKNPIPLSAEEENANRVASSRRKAKPLNWL